MLQSRLPDSPPATAALSGENQCLEKAGSEGGNSSEATQSQAVTGYRDIAKLLSNSVPAW